MPDEIATEGKWLDTKTNTIVTSQPEEGVQLVAEGTPITPYVRDTVERYETAVADAQGGEVETAADTDKGTGRKAEQPDGGDPSKTVTTTQTSTSTRKGS